MVTPFFYFPFFPPRELSKREKRQEEKNTAFPTGCTSFFSSKRGNNHSPCFTSRFLSSFPNKTTDLFPPLIFLDLFGSPLTIHWSVFFLLPTPNVATISFVFLICFPCWQRPKKVNRSAIISLFLFTDPNLLIEGLVSFQTWTFSFLPTVSLPTTPSVF